MVWTAVLACAVDYEVHEDLPDVTAAPVLEHDPGLSLEAALDETVEGELAVANVGSAALSITDAWLSGDSDFSLLDWPAELAPGESGWITVGFAPTTQRADAVLTLATTDPDRPEVDIPLTGTGGIPELTLTPEEVTFDGVLLGCTDTEVLTLTNTGTAALTVEALSSSAAGITAEVSLPLFLAPGESAEATLSFTPAEARVYTSTLSAVSTDPTDPTAAARGEGVLGAAVEERFRQGGGERGAVDLLFTIDQSCSMRDEQAALGEEAVAMFEALQDTGVDYQVMVITSDGCHSGAILTETTSNAGDVFADALSGDKTRLTESGLSQARNALELTGSGECNSGFLRDGVTPSLIHISDEPEQSDEGWSSVLGDILTIAPRTLVSAIAGDYPDGCPGAYAGTGYYQATQATGGLFLSICDTDWAAHIEELVDISTSISGEQLDTFLLEEVPVEETLYLTIDGVVTQSGWSYDRTQNAVVFEVMPEPDTLIVATFHPVCQP